MHRLVGLNDRPEVVLIHMQACTQNQLLGQAIDARKAPVGFASQHWQLLVEASRQVAAHIAGNARDDVLIVQEPFGRGSDRLAQAIGGDKVQAGPMQPGVGLGESVQQLRAARRLAVHGMIPRHPPDLSA